MFIEDISIVNYLIVGMVGLIIGQFIDWCNIRLPEYKKILSKDFFKVYIKTVKIKYIYSIIIALLYIGTLYRYGMTITCVRFLILIPMLICTFVIDYKEKIIPNRLNLTMFEIGLIFAFIEGFFNINVAIDLFMGMIVGAGVFFMITLIGGLIAGKEAMGFGDVKLMGALGLFFGWRLIIVISLIAFLLGAIIGSILIIVRKKSQGDYIPFGPFIVLGALITMLVPFNILLIVLLKIFTLGTIKI